MPTYRNVSESDVRLDGLITDGGGSFVSPGDAFSTEMYLDDERLVLISDEPYYMPIVSLVNYTGAIQSNTFDIDSDAVSVLIKNTGEGNIGLYIVTVHDDTDVYLMDLSGGESWGWNVNKRAAKMKVVFAVEGEGTCTVVQSREEISLV
jgi:hypothetical protein